VRLITARSNGSTTSFVTDDLFGDADEYNGYWWLGTDAPNDGVQARVVNTTESSFVITLTLHPAVSSTLSADTAELWDPKYNPVDVLRAINQAIIDATGRVYDPVEDISLHGSLRRSRHAIPSGIDMLNKVSYRHVNNDRLVIAGGQVWDESIDSDFTVTLDDEDLLFGEGATKFAIAGTVSQNNLASDSITSLDLSKYTHIEFPIKVVTAVSAGDLTIRLSATANGAAATDDITIPALSARSDTWVRVALANPESDTAIISVALVMTDSSPAANTVWVGEIRATTDRDEDWVELPNHMWRIDQQASDLILSPEAVGQIGYRLIKLNGGDAPALLSSDSDVCEVPEDYVIYRACAHLLEAHGSGVASDELGVKARTVGRFFGLASRVAFPVLQNVRRVS
jgi:hypothetical protein